MPEIACELTEVGRVFRTAAGSKEALSGVSFSVVQGKTLGIIGESGAGKSTLVRILAGLDKATSGRVLVGGAAPRIRRGAPSPVQMVFQSPVAALSPYQSVGSSVAEPIRKLAKTEREDKVRSLFERVGISPLRAGDKPTRFSGGELQRIVLARALISDPTLLLCDEPTSALDVSVQSQVINLLLELQPEKGFASIVVTHDLAVAKVLADDVLVLRSGRVEELAPAENFFEAPQSAYSQSLMAACRGLERSRGYPQPADQMGGEGLTRSA
jgi:ABC-type glutathione transport system ATPase component